MAGLGCAKLGLGRQDILHFSDLRRSGKRPLSFVARLSSLVSPLSSLLSPLSPVLSSLSLPLSVVLFRFPPFPLPLPSRLYYLFSSPQLPHSSLSHLSLHDYLSSCSCHSSLCVFVVALVPMTSEGSKTTHISERRTTQLLLHRGLDWLQQRRADRGSSCPAAAPAHVVCHAEGTCMPVGRTRCPLPGAWRKDSLQEPAELVESRAASNRPAKCRN